MIIVLMSCFRTKMFLFFFLFIGLMAGAQPWKEHGQLKVSDENPHYFSHLDGTPFFWLADTGWEMLHRLSREEMEVYLDNRSTQGFNVIQTVIISEFIHMDKLTNYYGDSIFINNNTDYPLITPGNYPEDETAYDYWDHVDYALRVAEKKGLYLALLPSWGEWLTPRTDHALFNHPEQAYNYGWFLGNRYRSSPNLIWMLGGDRHPDERSNGLDLWRAMAEGIADGANQIKKMDGQADYSSTLMTYHSYNSSSSWFHHDAWIDFHAWGSYHTEVNNSRSYLLAHADWVLNDPKPTLNAEPCYEGHGINYAIDDNGVFTSTDVRLAAYWSVFSGSAGFTYGSHPIWQFTDESRKKHSPKTFSNWQEAMEMPGASQLAHLKKLMLSFPLFELQPDQTLVVSGQHGYANYIPAIRGKSFALIYVPSGGQVEIQMGIITGEKVNASWFDPRLGLNKAIGTFENSGKRVFDVPSMSEELSWLRSGRGCDWVLILEGNDRIGMNGQP